MAQLSCRIKYEIEVWEWRKIGGILIVYFERVQEKFEIELVTEF